MGASVGVVDEGARGARATVLNAPAASTFTSMPLVDTGFAVPGHPPAYKDF